MGTQLGSPAFGELVGYRQRCSKFVGNLLCFVSLAGWLSSPSSDVRVTQLMLLSQPGGKSTAEPLRGPKDLPQSRTPAGFLTQCFGS